MVIAWQDLIAIADLLTKSEAKRSILTLTIIVIVILIFHRAHDSSF